MRKKLFGIALLLALLVPVPATMLWLEIQREGLHEEAKLLLDQDYSDDELVQIRIAPNEQHMLSWKDAHEFLYQSKMYDVVRSVDEDGIRTYFCLEDGKETRLEARMNKVLNSLYGRELPGQQNELQLVYLLEFLDLPPLFSYFLGEEPPLEHFFGYLAQFSEITQPSDSPPPQTV